VRRSKNVRAQRDLNHVGPGLGEQVGVAVNSSKLVLEAGHTGALDLIAGLGYASCALLAEAQDEPDRIAAHLGPELWRAKYGYDHEAVIVCVVLFDRRLRCRHPYFTEIERAEPGLVLRFSAQVLHEWLSDQCTSCGGSGVLELSGRGVLVRPSGRYRNAKLHKCGACRGAGRRQPREPERRKALSANDGRRVHHLEYEDFWRRQFAIALTDLRRVASSPRSHLQKALGRDTVAA
jgi:hypothetical protein